MINKSMKKDIQNILNSCPKNARKKYLSADMIEWLNNEFPNKPFSYQCFLALSNDPIPKCPVCNGLPDKGKTTCSRECREKLKVMQGESSIQKMNRVLQETRGVDNAAKLKSTQNKRIQTNIEKYGSKVSDKTRHSAKSRADILNQKGRQTLKARYGVSNAGQMIDHRKKCQDTLKRNYGVDNYFSSVDWKEQKEIQKFDRFVEMINSHAQVLTIHSPSRQLKEVYQNPNDRVEIQCNQCDNVEILTSETIKYRLRTFGKLCSKCLQINKGSVAESQIAEFLNEYVQVERNNRTIIAPFELDIVIEECKVAIEYCGLYWHNDKRIDKSYHHKKMKRCKENGYSLITIFEDEWLHKPEIVKSRLLHKLGLCKNKIYARKTECKQIEPAVARQFCDMNHIQGYHNANVNYGLFDNDCLVAIMTFRKGDISKRQSGWELSRFCSLSDTTVLGAASKLFKAFIKQFDPEHVVTFSDLRWNNGDVYNSLGFKFVSYSSINYWYIDGTKRKHRYALRKHSGEDSSKTEFEIRDSQGWNRIWDCGNAKYVWSP